MTMNTYTDIGATYSFTMNYSKFYGNNHVPFHTCSFDQAVNEACYAPIRSRKILALYFYNETDPFSKLFCPTLVEGDIRNIIEESFYFIGWDITDEKYHSALNASLNKYLPRYEMLDWITRKRSALFILYPIEDSIVLNSVIYGNKMKVKEILGILRAFASSFKSEIENELELEDIKKKSTTENDMGSKNFQQMMYNGLGDRDYNCFELNEHELLKMNIGYAKFGPPQNENGYTAKQKTSIEATFKQIRKYNNRFSEWDDQIIISYIYNCLEPLPKEKIARSKKYKDYNPNTDIIPVPIFIIRKCIESENPCRIIIDNDNRVYNTWNEYLEENKHHECIMVVPKNGKYDGDEEGRVILEKFPSPACGIGKNILKGLDIGVTITGIVTGGIFVAAAIPTIAVAPIALTGAAVTGACVGAYSIIRGAISIYDRHVHGESLSFLNSEVRGAYINIMAGSLGFVGMGAATVVSQLASRGVNIGQGARLTLNTIGILNIGAGVCSSTYQVINNWIEEQKTPSLLTIVQLSSSILFFGNAVYNFKMADTIIEESQANTLKDIQESLRSNRHGKTFSKMVKETVRQNNGETQAAHAEVIATVQNMGNKDEMFAVLTRNNKIFNKYGVKFKAENGEITLNGETVDISNFGSTGKPQRAEVLVDLSKLPEPSVNKNIGSGITKFNSLGDLNISFSLNKQDYLRVIPVLLNFSSPIQDKLVQIFEIVIDALKIKFSSTTEHNKIMEFIIEFIEYIKRNYEACFNNTGVKYFNKVLDYLLVNAKRINSLFNKLVKFVVNKIFFTVYNWINSKEKRIKREENCAKKNKVNCTVCGGYYFKLLKA